MKVEAELLAVQDAYNYQAVRSGEDEDSRKLDDTLAESVENNIESFKAEFGIVDMYRG